MFFDLHCDTVGEYALRNADLYDGGGQISLKKGEYLRRWTQFFAIWIPDEKRGKDAVEYFRSAREYFDRQLSLHADRVALCLTPEDIRRAHEDNKCAALLSVEGSAAAGGELDGIDALYRQGVRMMTLTWNGKCEFADGVFVPYAGGLTALGRLAVRRCEKLGMVVDVSHLSENGFWDVVETAKKPFVASHSNARSVCTHPRNLTDEQFEAIMSKGGLVGINFYPLFVSGGEDASLRQLLDHIDHFLTLGGEDTLCMGSDFDGANMPKELPDIAALPALKEEMRRAGYSEKLIEKLFYRNAEAFFEKALTSPGMCNTINGRC